MLRPMIDIAIVIAVAAGAFAGWRKGFVVPLVVQAGALVSLAALYAGPFQSSVPSGLSGIGVGVGTVVLASSLLGAIGGTLIRLVYRFGVLKRMDKVAGIPLGAATAAVTLYVVLVGTVVVDGWLGPLHGGLAIGPEQLASVQKLAALNPALSMGADTASGPSFSRIQPSFTPSPPGPIRRVPFIGRRTASESLKWTNSGTPVVVNASF